MDVDSIEPGLDFFSILQNQVANCEILLALIGRGWLSASDEEGRRRLANPSDFVRIEIASGLTQGKRIIPVLVGPATMPRDEDLPEELKPLARRQAFRLTHENFNADVERLIRVLSNALTAAEEQVQRKAEEERQRAEAETKRKADEERQQAEAEAKPRPEEQHPSAHYALEEDLKHPEQEARTYVKTENQDRVQEGLHEATEEHSPQINETMSDNQVSGLVSSELLPQHVRQARIKEAIISLSIAVYNVLLIFWLYALGSGPDAWSQWIAFVKSPLGVILSVLIFGFAVVHTITWLKTGPQSIRTRYRKDIL